ALRRGVTDTRGTKLVRSGDAHRAAGQQGRTALVGQGCTRADTADGRVGVALVDSTGQASVTASAEVLAGQLAVARGALVSRGASPADVLRQGAVVAGAVGTGAEVVLGIASSTRASGIATEAIAGSRRTRDAAEAVGALLVDPAASSLATGRDALL